jgi:hypothetical protein
MSERNERQKFFCQRVAVICDSLTNIKKTTLSMSSINAIKDNTVRVRPYCSSKNRQSVTMSDEVRDGEIVGLESSTNGCSCGSHECCGKHLCVEDLVRFRLVILEGDGDGQDTDAMKVIKIKDGT